jgi:hypothetical protein
MASISAESRKADGTMASRVVLEQNAPAEIEFDDSNLRYGCGQMTQHREDRAQVRSVFGWDSTIVFAGTYIMPSSASATA